MVKSFKLINSSSFSPFVQESYIVEKVFYHSLSTIKKKKEMFQGTEKHIFGESNKLSKLPLVTPYF